VSAKESNSSLETAQGGLPRITSGNAELDSILHGGFPANSINIILGEPGSGKTILAESLIFANATAGDRPILYLTTLSEPLEKVVRYLQQYTFFDLDKIGDTVVYESLGPELAEKGIAALLPRLKEIIRERGPKLIVIDSFKAIHDLAANDLEMRLVMYQMAGLLTAYETTAFLVGEYNEGQIAQFPEFAVSDGILELARAKTGTRDERYLRVLKLRGSAYLEGLHGFSLSQDGIDVFPRLVSPHVAPSYDIQASTAATGIQGLDEMLDGGLLRGTSTMVLGSTGSGKTTLGLQFILDGLAHGEPGLYVHFEENPYQLRNHIHKLGHNLDDLQGQGFVSIYASPVELQIDRIVGMIFRVMQRTRIRRVVIDAVGGLRLAASDEDRVQGFLYALVQHLATEGICSILTHEAFQLGVEEPRLSALADNIILLGVLTDGKVRRTIRVVKARNLDHDLQEHEMCISKKGIVILK
jgi:circadian clock protein KaiC